MHVHHVSRATAQKGKTPPNTHVRKHACHATLARHVQLRRSFARRPLVGRRIWRLGWLRLANRHRFSRRRQCGTWSGSCSSTRRPSRRYSRVWRRACGLPRGRAGRSGARRAPSPIFSFFAARASRALCAHFAPTLRPLCARFAPALRALRALLFVLLRAPPDPPSQPPVQGAS